MARKLAYLCIALIICLAPSAMAQSTALTYQGKLSDNGNPANGNYDFQFKLFDLLSGGTQQGITMTVASVAVAGGIFTVQLDFGAAMFPGADRYIEIAVKQAGGPTFATLSPRQPVSATPYAIKSLNAAQLEGQSAGGFVQNTTTPQATTNFNISGNGTAGGTLSAMTVNAATQYSIAGLRVLTVSGPFNNGTTIFTASNTFVGDGAGLNTTPSPVLTNINGKLNAFFGAGAGQANTTGNNNAFFGASAGRNNTAGANNTFVGAQAGLNNTTGCCHSFFGSNAGFNNSTGSSNSFFGFGAGFSNSTGSSNSFFGLNAGRNNSTANRNSFFGLNAGFSNSTGGDNSFFGYSAGLSNTTGGFNTFFGENAGNGNDTGSSNAFFGYFAGAFNSSGLFNAFFGANAGFNNITGTDNTILGSGSGFTADNTIGNSNTLLGSGSTVTADLSNQTAVGANARVDVSNALVLGSISGVNGAFADTNVGIGITAPAFKLHVIDQSNTGLRVQTNTAGGTVASFGIQGDFQIDAPSAFGGRFVVKESGNVGIGTGAPATLLHISGVGAVRARINATGNAGLALTLNDLPGWSLATVTGGQFQIFNDSIAQNAVWIDPATNNFGINTSAPADRLDVNGIVRISALGSAGATTLCRNASNQISTCSSSLRYKTNLASFRGGLNLVSRLKPITFNWRANGEADLGLAAEEVAKVEPLLVTHNDKGEVEGVKYDRVGVVLINVVQEQQIQITAQHSQIEKQKRIIERHQQQFNEQQQQIEVLKKLVCSSRRRAKACQ